MISTRAFAEHVFDAGKGAGKVELHAAVDQIGGDEVGSDERDEQIGQRALHGAEIIEPPAIDRPQLAGAQAKEGEEGSVLGQIEIGDAEEREEEAGRQEEGEEAVLENAGVAVAREDEPARSRRAWWGRCSLCRCACRSPLKLPSLSGKCLPGYRACS